MFVPWFCPLLLVGVVRVVSIVFLVLIRRILILECVFVVLRLMEDTRNDNNSKIYAEFFGNRLCTARSNPSPNHNASVGKLNSACSGNLTGLLSVAAFTPSIILK